MTSALLTRFVEQRPFEPFTLVTADGRDFHVPHPEYVSLGGHVLSVMYLHPNGQVEFIDAALVVSVRTVYAADVGSYRE
jgi:hypothetical protein